ncbi:MAG TPA: helix-turn-helix domain-containing protein [Devosia sp.]|jgi:excisionase family DNA binding protein|nr:helix-turn-helix domain-containing protein [Devosia sp.]
MTIQRVFYGPREVAEILGVSKKHIYQLLKANKLPHIRVGRLIRISLADVKVLRSSYDENGLCMTDPTAAKHRAALLAYHERRRAALAEKKAAEAAKAAEAKATDGE